MLNISEEIKQVIMGGLLGDSGIAKNKSKHYLYIHHGHKQLDYLTHKFKFFEKENLTTPKGIYINSSKEYISYRFYTKTNDLFTYYRDLFYKDSIKQVTINILDELNPLGLAIWYMDDGNKNIIKITSKSSGNRLINGRTLTLATCNFTYEEHLLIQEYFKNKWNIEVKIRNDKKYYKIVLNATNANKFISLIHPYIIDSMKYKIDLQYTNVTQSNWIEDMV